VPHDDERSSCRKTSPIPARERIRWTVRDRARRPAFTLVELLVVIAIIGILVALLLPGVQAAREAARRLQCQNSLKQLALACHNYALDFGSLPPAAHWQQGVSCQPQNNANVRENWVILVLPYLEQQNLYDKFDRSQPITHANNAELRGTVLPVMLCPSDAYNRVKFSGKAGSPHTSNLGSNWGRGNYGANGSLGFFSDSAHCTGYGVTNIGCAATDASWKSPLTRGVMGVNRSSTFDDLRDGTSQTFMLLELRAGVVDFDPRGVWALAGAGASSLCAYGYLGDSGGPNAQPNNADDTAGCNEVEAAVGGDAALSAMKMPCFGGTSSNPNRQASPRSLHAGGVFIAMCDGSVKWIANNIQVSTTVTYASVWDRLCLSQDGNTISPADY